MGAAAAHVVLCGGARIMRRKLTAALILAALIGVCVSGCHVRVTVHADPVPHGSAALTEGWPPRLQRVLARGSYPWPT
jgi:hypothetical protein